MMLENAQVNAPKQAIKAGVQKHSVLVFAQKDT